MFQRIAFRVVIVLVLLSGLYATSQTTPPPLIPMPREYSARPALSLAHGAVVIATVAEDRFAANDFADWLDALHVPKSRAAGIRIELLRAGTTRSQAALRQGGVKPFDPAMEGEGYAMVRTPQGVAIVADTSAGIFYGVQTLKQMVQGTGDKAKLMTAEVRDWPAMRYRGVSDDLSRGPVPTVDFQKKQIRTLAAYKVNVYSPYFEHTLQYQSNPLAAVHGGSMSADDVRELVEYAQRYHVMIVPEQEAFGHLHHVLTYEQYAPLSETKLGAVLAPGQSGSMDLIAQWFEEIAKLFPAPLLHIGADETFDLGKGQTKTAVDALGLGLVYVDFLTRVHARLAPLHRRLLFWGDVAMNDPQLVKTLPKDMIAVAWEYSPQPDGFQEWLKPYTDAGMETWVAPGVNNWNRVYPDNDYALRNIQGFAADGQTAHSTGLLNTVWNDDGEGLFLEDWYGVLFGAAAAWQPGSSNIAEYQQSYGPVFHGDATGDINSAQLELTAANKLLTDAKVPASTDRLFWADPWSTEGQAMAVEIRPLQHLIRQHAERALTLLANARAAGTLRETDAIEAMELGARKLDFIGLKFETADEIASLYTEAYASQSDQEKAKNVSRLIWTISGVNGLCQDMRDGYSELRSEYQDVWMKENRPYWLQNVLARYDLTTQMWLARADRFQGARSQWGLKHTLPAPAELGIPAQ